MAVYSEVISNESILKSIPENVKNILIVACGGCMNESLAYKNDCPIFMHVNDEAIPYASFSEAHRIVEFLNIRGYSSNAKVIPCGTPVLCIYSEDYKFVFHEDFFQPDAILALCCDAGLQGLKLIFSVPVISITKRRGLLFYTYQDLPNGNRITLKKKSATILDSKG
jgi:hypothetical protein